MPSITPSLWFDNNLEEAAQFYASIFPTAPDRMGAGASDGYHRDPGGHAVGRR